MMSSLSRTALFSLMAMGTLSLPQMGLAQEPDTSATAQRESARKQLALRDAMQEVQEARLAYQARRYSEAVERYRNALAVLPKAPATQGQEKFIRDSLSDALIAKAMDYRAVGRAEEAVEFLHEALELSPSNQRAKEELVRTGDAVRQNPALTPKHVGDVEEVNRLLTLAYGYLDLGKYDEAIKTFQSVSQYDAYNTAAQRGIEQAQKRRSAYYATAHDSARAHALAEVDAQWEEGMPTDTGIVAPAEASDVSQVADEELINSYSTRLSEMVMPSIVFDDASVVDVLEALQNQITRFESQGVQAGRHINLIPNFGLPDSPGYRELMEKTISLNLTQVSVRDVLDMLTRQLGISYFYVPSGVEVSYSGKDFGPLMERTFHVPPHFFDSEASSASSSSDEEGEEDAFSDSSQVTVRRVSPAEALRKMGISFPKGATASYFPSNRQLRVRNTAHNLEEIQDLLSIPMEGQRQVVLNVIAMEVSEEDLNELGFEWLLNVSLGGEMFGSGGAAEATSAVTGMPVFAGQLQPRQAAPSISNGLRTGSQAISANNIEKLISRGSAALYSGEKGQPAPGIFGIRGVWNTADVTMIMRGLSQKKGVDIMQNPRIVFSPGMGEQVTFANVNELFFPETWEPAQVTTSNQSYGYGYNSQQVAGSSNSQSYSSQSSGSSSSGGSSSSNRYSDTTVATGAMPQDFVRFGMTEDGIGGVGTILQVHSAEISENGRYVTLALTTTVNDFEGFINWGSPIYSVAWSGDSDIQKIMLTPNHILQPMIKRYVENTKVTVVPGTVLVMGGLKEARKVRYEDKIPVLGDLPLVGRFFRSEGEEKVRKALVFFAKVDVIDPTGRDVNTGERPSQMTDDM